MSDTIEGIEQQIASNRQAHRQQSAELANDSTLIPDAKRIKQAELAQAAADRHDALIARRGQAISLERDRLYAAAFQRGIASIDSYRDVYSMADRAPTPADLRRLMGQAERTNDPALQRACLQVAYDREWLQLLENAGEDVQRLLEFEFDRGLRSATGSARTRQLERRLADAARITAPH